MDEKVKRCIELKSSVQKIVENVYSVEKFSNEQIEEIQQKIYNNLDNVLLLLRKTGEINNDTKRDKR